ncbi:energy-coupling factor ABC transporter ATP-binding protein [Spirochaetota bacterium]
MTDKLFLVEGLRFSYNKSLTLSCDSLVIKPSLCTVFRGPNGSGKTTMLKILNNLLGPFAGRVEFDGQAVQESTELRRRSMYVHQHPVMFASTVEANIRHAMRLKKYGKAEADTRLASINREFNLDALLNKKANRLSGGETQRVAIARAIACGVDTLLFDEPTSSMDREMDAIIKKMLLKLKNDGYSIIMASHDDELIDAIADHVVSFERGVCKGQEN